MLLSYPTPAIFLYEYISPEGRSVYNVVDGKQRLTTLFEFVRNEFPVSEKAEITNLQGLYFQGLDDRTKTAFWSYQFIVEYLPNVDAQILSLRFKHEEFCDGLYIRRKTLSLGDPCVQALFFMAG